MSNNALAAKQIRQWLKAQGIKSRVTSKSYSMGSNVNIFVEDMPPERAAQIKAYANQFEMGSFDGMIDLYEYDNVRDDIPQVKFVFVHNGISNTLRLEIWDFALKYYAGMEDAPVDAREAVDYMNDSLNEYGSELIYRLFNGSDPAFWASKA